MTLVKETGKSQGDGPESRKNDRKKNSKQDQTKKKAGDSKEIFIHVYQPDELKDQKKLTQDFENVVRQVPRILEYASSVTDLIQIIFPERLTSDITVMNETTKSAKGTLRRRCRIYSRRNARQSELLSENRYFVFEGDVSRGEFMIRGLQIWENPVWNEKDDTNQKVVIHYGAQSGRNNLLDA